MKYISYFIFLGFIALLLFFLKNALEPKEEPVLITGSDKCGECHQLQMLGNQTVYWQTSRHRAAYISLQSQLAKDFAAKNNIAEPIKNELCLSCHTTSGILKGFGGQLSYKIEEGVGCEGCHGAGSGYSPTENMKDEELFKRHGGIVGDEKVCLECHSPKANTEHKISEDSCPFQDEDFNYKAAFEKIKHPVNRDNFK
jgi:hypothetical protein